MSTKLHIKKGDKVVVTAGNYKGKESVVTRVFPKTNRAIVEGVNVAKKHVKPTQAQPNGGIVEKELSIHASNLKKVN